MAFSYKGPGRDQLFLMPLDIRDWLAEDHLVWFILDVVERLDTSGLHELHPNDRAGRPAYDPEVLLALLVYAYCTGVRSSRKIEQACRCDVAYRVICANQVPDHSTVSRFRQAHDRFAQELFVEALRLCAEAGLNRVGLVAIDGTKMAADAAMAANVSSEKLTTLVGELFAEAASNDQAEDLLFGPARGDELPGDVAGRQRRAARLDAAMARMKALQKAKADEAAAWAAQADEVEAKARADGRVPLGQPPLDRRPARAETALARAEARAAAQTERARLAAQVNRQVRLKKGEYNYVKRARERLERARAEEAEGASRQRKSDRAPSKVNLTDPGSRVLMSPSGYLQGYNAQAAVNEPGVVLAAEVSQEASDATQALPMVKAFQANLAASGAEGQVTTVLFDAGYWSEANALAPGPARLIATGRSWQLRAKTRSEGYRQGPPPLGARPVEAMEHLLCTQQGAALYARRAVMIEPIFGQHKHDRGFRRFSRRGLGAVQAEWKLINTTSNLLKLFRASQAL